MNEIQHTILEADRAGFRLEFVNGLGVWEASPILRHQKKVDAIRATIGPANQTEPCACVHYADIQVAFPDGSQKRPDIAIFAANLTSRTARLRYRPKRLLRS